MLRGHCPGVKSAFTISLPLTTDLKRHWPKTQLYVCQLWGSHCRFPYPNGTKQLCNSNMLTRSLPRLNSFHFMAVLLIMHCQAPFLCWSICSEFIACIGRNKYNLSHSKANVRSSIVSNPFTVCQRGFSLHRLPWCKWLAISKQEQTAESISCFNIRKISQWLRVRPLQNQKTSAHFKP